MPRYNDNILNYYNDDSRVGSLDVNDKNVGTGLVGSPSCGDVMKLQIKIKEDKKTGEKTIEDAKILVFGCGSAKASSSYVADQLIGKTLKEAMQIKNTNIAKSLGLPKIKLHCSVLAESAIKRAIEDYNQKNLDIVSNASDKTNTNEDKLAVERNGNKRKNKVINKSINKKKNIAESLMADTFAVSITPEAVEFVKQNLKKLNKNVIGIRLSLEEGHCGLMYKVRYVLANENIDNYTCWTHRDLKIFSKTNEASILNGTKIEYKEEGLKRGLVFTNPKEIGKCNCGLNFFTKDKQKINKS